MPPQKRTKRARRGPKTRVSAGASHPQNVPGNWWAKFLPAFPAGYAYGSVVGIVLALLSYVGIPDQFHVLYIVGWAGAAFASLTGLIFEWRKNIVALNMAPVAQRRLVFAGLGSGVIALALVLIATALFIFNSKMFPAPLVFHKPVDVRFGNVLADGKQRIYVHASVDNTLDSPVTFQEYSKAVIEPLKINRAASEAASDNLKDDIRKFATGDDAPIITATARESYVGYDMPGPAISLTAFERWKRGESLIIYATYVYAKVQNGTRFMLHDCELVRAITTRADAGSIPGVGAVWVSYPSTIEAPCDLTPGG